MWKADLEMERCVPIMFCIQKKVVQIPCVNHFVLEKLTVNVSELAGYSRLDENQFALRTFGSVSIFLNSTSGKVTV